MEMAKVAVIVTTYKRPQVLAECLVALSEQKRAGDIVVVVDDGSANRNAAKAADYYVWQADDGYRLATARNAGASVAIAAGAETLIFLDGDIVPCAGWLDVMREVDNNVAFGTINSKTLTSSNTRPWLCATGGNMAVPVSVWDLVGPFDEVFNQNWGVEDTDWAFRAYKRNIPLVHVSADVLHAAHPPRVDWRKQQITNWGKFEKKYGAEVIGRRPEPARTDTRAERVVHSDGVFWVVTTTRDRPEEAERWQSERLTWGLPVVLADDSIDPYALELSPHSIWTKEAGTSSATRQAIQYAFEHGAEYVIELDDHDFFRDGLADVRRICQALLNGADYVYGNYILTYKARRNKIVPTAEYERGILSRSGMVWMGVKAYNINSYFAVGGYKDEEFPAGDFSLALRFECAGKNIVRCPDVWTVCPMTADSLTSSRAAETHEKVLEYQSRYCNNSLSNT